MVVVTWPDGAERREATSRRALWRWHLLWHAGRVVACGGLEPVAVAGGRQHGGVVHDPVDDRGGGDVRLLRTIESVDFTGQEPAALNKLTMPIRAFTLTYPFRT